MTSGYILFGSRQSGHSYKVRLALLLIGAAHDYRAVDLAQPREARDPDLIRHSRFGEVPLLLVDGRPIVQSNAILLHLARSHDALGWPDHRGDIEQWLFWEANRIGLSLPNYRLARLFAPQTPAEVAAWMRARMLDDLATLETALGDRAYLLGDGVSAADIACSAYLLYRDIPDLDLNDFPSVRAWLARIEALPRWRAPLDIMGRSSAISRPAPATASILSP